MFYCPKIACYSRNVVNIFFKSGSHSFNRGYVLSSCSVPLFLRTAINIGMKINSFSDI